MLESFLHWLGFGLCHQLPERSYFGGGLQASVCARDTGIYVGFVCAIALIAFMHRGERPRGFPRAHVWLAMGAFLLFMAWDGITSYAGLRETTNQIRLLSGLGVGFSVAALIVPMLNDEVWRFAGNVRVLDPAWRFWSWLLAVPAVFGLVEVAGKRLGVGLPLLIAACIIATLASINLVIVAMLPAFDRRAESWRHLLVPVLIAVALAFAEIALAAQMRTLLDAAVLPLAG